MGARRRGSELVAPGSGCGGSRLVCSQLCQPRACRAQRGSPGPRRALPVSLWQRSALPVSSQARGSSSGRAQGSSGRRPGVPPLSHSPANFYNISPQRNEVSARSPPLAPGSGSSLGHSVRRRLGTRRWAISHSGRSVAPSRSLGAPSPSATGPGGVRTRGGGEGRRLTCKTRTPPRAWPGWPRSAALNPRGPRSLCRGCPSWEAPWNRLAATSRAPADPGHRAQLQTNRAGIEGGGRGRRRRQFAERGRQRRGGSQRRAARERARRSWGCWGSGAAGFRLPCPRSPSWAHSAILPSLQASGSEEPLGSLADTDPSRLVERTAGRLGKRFVLFLRLLTPTPVPKSRVMSPPLPIYRRSSSRPPSPRRSCLHCAHSRWAGSSLLDCPLSAD